MASIYQRKKLYWIAYTDENGLRQQKSLFELTGKKVRDRKVALYYKNEIENRIARKDSPLQDTSTTIKQAFEDFKISRKGIISDKAERTDYPRIQAFITAANITRPTEITRAKLKAHLDDRIKGPPKTPDHESKDGISHRTANHTIRILKTFLRYCVELKYAPSNPLSRMPLYPVDDLEPRFLSPDECKTLIETAQGSPIERLLMVLLYTGMRLGEAERLTWEDIDFKNNKVTVQKSKRRKFRKIPLFSDLKKYLLKEDHRSGNMFSFRTRESLEWQFDIVYNDLPEGFRDFHLHDLRHTFASLCVRLGVDIYTLSKWLGHATVKTTEIYAHLYPDHGEEFVGKNLF